MGQSKTGQLIRSWLESLKRERLWTQTGSDHKLGRNDQTLDVF